MACHDIVVVGGSMGAFEAVKQLVSDLPADLTAAVLVSLHIGQHGGNLLASILDRHTALKVITAEEGAPIERGTVYVAPADRHLLVVDGVVSLGRGPRENMARPAIDPLFRSAAVACGSRVVAVLLSGRLNDGSAGLAAVKRCGGVSVVQNPSDAPAAEMPLSALRSLEVDYRAPIADLGQLLVDLVAQAPGPPGPPTPDLELEVEIAAGHQLNSARLRSIAQPTTFSCPGCGGVLSEMHSKPPLRFRCQVGHAYTAEILHHHVDEATDEALRVALRIIDERATLSERMADDARANGRQKSAAMHEDRARQLRHHGETLRQALLHAVPNGGLSADD